MEYKPTYNEQLYGEGNAENKITVETYAIYPGTNVQAKIAEIQAYVPNDATFEVTDSQIIVRYRMQQKKM